MQAWWESFISGLTSDFIDLPDGSAVAHVLIRLVVAAILGGILGFDREIRGKDAGWRTHMLVSVGTAFFILVPDQIGMNDETKGRVMQGIIAGMGFVGGGAILKQQEKGVVKGLTTATGLWLTAAVGISAGLGRLATAVVATVVAFVILSALTPIEKRMKVAENPGLSGEQV